MGKASRRKSIVNRQGVLERAKKVVRSFAGVKGISVRSDLPQEKKISHALGALLANEVPKRSSLEEYRAALDFIVIAWNISLLEADKRSDVVNRFVEAIKPRDEAMRRELLGNIEGLISSKLVMFPHDQRYIVSWDVSFQGDMVHISAAALAAPPSRGASFS